MNFWNRRDILALAVLFLGISLFHSRGLLPGQVFLPVDLAENILPWRSATYQPLQNPLISDPLYEFYPFQAYAVDTVKAGRIPLWNTAIYLGHPTFADPLAHFFYPVYLILGLIFGAARGLSIGLWLHVLLSAFLMYGFLRAIQTRRYAAVIGAFTYSLGGYLVTWFEATHRVTTLAWLPGILWAFEIAIQRRNIRYAALGGVLFALAFLGGQYQFLTTFSLFLALYALGRSIEIFKTYRRDYFFPFGVLFIIALLGVMLSAIQIVPFAQFLGLSQRVVESGLSDALPPLQLITLLVPNFFGNPVLAPENGYHGFGLFVEAIIYAGLPALFFAMLSPIWSPKFFTIYLFGVLLLIIYFIVGAPGVSLLGALPIVKYASLRRSAFILPLIIGVLAATGLSGKRITLKSALIAGLIFISLIGLALFVDWRNIEDYWQYTKIWVTQAIITLILLVIWTAAKNYFQSYQLQLNWALVALVFADLFIFGYRFNPVGPVDVLTSVAPSTAYLQEHAAQSRIVTIQHEVLFGPNVPLTFGLSEAGGYTSMHSAQYHNLVAADMPNSWWMNENRNVIAFTNPSSRLLDLVQATYFITPVLADDVGIRAERLVDGCNSVTPEIVAASPVSGTVLAHNVAINRVDMRFAMDKASQSEQLLTARLWEQGKRDKLLLDASFFLADLADDGLITHYFSPEIDAPGRVYVWEVSTPAPTSTVKLCAVNGEPAVSVYGNEYNLVHQSGRVFVYNRPAPLPRAYVAYSAQHVPNEMAVERLLDKEFDLRRSVIVARPVDLPPTTDKAIDRAEIIDYTPTRVEIDATAAQEGILVLGDQFYPGWRAYVDGKPTPIIQTNYVMRGVMLPAGDHQIIFKFQPTSLIVGASISAIGLLFVIIIFLAPSSLITQLSRRSVHLPGSCSEFKSLEL